MSNDHEQRKLKLKSEEKYEFIAKQEIFNFGSNEKCVRNKFRNLQLPFLVSRDIKLEFV